MSKIRIGGLIFEMHTELMDVTSLRRPDTSWRVIDANGHEHRWYVNGQPAASYDPEKSYETPTLVWVKDGEEQWDDDDEPHDIGHLECRECGEHISPRYTADTTTQHIPGIVSCRINGERVSPEEYKARYEQAMVLRSDYR